MYKLESSLQEASICLRCRYRLKLQKQHRPPRQQWLQLIRHFAVGRRLHQEQETLKDTYVTDNGVGKLPISYHLQDKPFSVRYERSNGKRPHDPIRPSFSQKGRLGINSLGQPAEVLILRERQEKQDGADFSVGTHVLQADNDQSPQATSSSDMLEEIDAERGIIEMDQACANIDSVKDEIIREYSLSWEASGGVIATKNYSEIASRLHEGFTIIQLASYLNRNAFRLPVDPLDLHHEYFSKLYTRSSWSHGTTDPWRIRAPDITKFGQSGSHSSRVRLTKPETQSPRKRVLVNRILHYCWRIRPVEDESSLGEMDMKLQLPHLELIINHERGILKQISETYGAKVEASAQDQAIRITSDYETSLDILRLIIHTLKNIKSAVVEFSSEYKPDLQASNSQKEIYMTILRHVMQSTNTIVRAKSSDELDQELTVYYLGPDESDLEDVRRLTGQILRRAPTKDSVLLAGRRNPKSKILFVPIDVGNRLSLTDRAQPWSRWCSQSIRAVDPNENREGASSRLNTLESPLDEQKIARALSDFFAIPDDHFKVAEKTRPCWTSNVTYWDSAMLGQVIFPRPAPQTEKKSRHSTSTVQPKTDTPREFITLVPGLVSSLEDINLSHLITKTPIEEFLLIRLTPSPKPNPLGPLSTIPDLEIRISFHEPTHTTSIHSVRLVHRTELDLLLPQNTTDLRFIRRTCVYARNNALNPAIQQFIQNSNLDIWGSGRLKTPRDLTLCIPPHALGPIRSSAGLEPQAVEYTFASLEHRSEISVPFHQPEDGSWAALTYSSVEAGKIGGRRDELCLQQRRRARNRVHAADHDEDVDDVSKQDPIDDDDDAYISSLLRNANALIHRIENPVDNSVELQHVERAKARLEEGGERRFGGGEKTEKGRGRRVPVRVRTVRTRRVVRRLRGVGD